MTVPELAKMREVILEVIDAGCPKHPGQPWLLYNGVDENAANQERLDFCDEVQRRLVERAKRND
jgi:hypothetical protein